MGVFCVLGQDALDLSGVIGGFVADDLDWNGCKIGFDSGECAPVTEAHTHVAAGSSYGDDRHQHTEVFDACDEVFVETCIGADVHVDEQARVDQDRPRRMTGVVVLSWACCPCRFVSRGFCPARRPVGRAEDGECKPEAADSSNVLRCARARTNARRRRFAASPDRCARVARKPGTGSPAKVSGWSGACKLGQSPAGRMYRPAETGCYAAARLRHGFVLRRLVVVLSDVRTADLGFSKQPDLADRQHVVDARLTILGGPGPLGPDALDGDTGALGQAKLGNLGGAVFFPDAGVEEDRGDVVELVTCTLTEVVGEAKVGDQLAGSESCEAQGPW